MAAEALALRVLAEVNKLSGDATVSSSSLASTLGATQQDVIGALNSLIARNMLLNTVSEVQEWVVTEEGAQIAKEGSHEAAVFNAIPASGSLSQADLQSQLGERAKIGLGKALKAGWIAVGNGQVTRKASSIDDVTQSQLAAVLANPAQPSVDASVLADLRKRKLANQVAIKQYNVAKGPAFALVLAKQATELTQEMIMSGSWKNVAFKKYNFDALGAVPRGGHLHPLLKVREQFRNIFLEFGFNEMPTNNWVESSFWNFDTLFQPQQHPARDAHDTFFIKDPANATSFPRDYLERVKEVHSRGGYGSLGYRYDWKEQEAQKNILRTHTTAVSSRMLYKLAQDPEGFKPTKYFSIDRVFRNETLDMTHLAEFHQIEGLIADYGLSLGHLIGTLEAFFNRLGMNKLRFKPAYNPYTEPSMEVFAYHEGLKRWIEIGNSGVFRPEMLRPMGLPEGVSVIAWGLSLERPTMILYGYDNIRDLCGHKIDLDIVSKNPICRLDQF